MTDELRVLDMLKSLQWEKSIVRTFGNSHCTLIGAIVQAWHLSANDRFALDGGCSPRKGHKDANYCDAILCKGNLRQGSLDTLTPVGIVEVELNPFPSPKSGKKPIFERMKSYFRSDNDWFKELSFAVLVVYGTKNLTDKLKQEGQQFATHVQQKRPGFRLFVVVIHRTKESHEGILSNPYYKLKITQVEWFAIAADVAEGTLYPLT